MVPKSLTLEEEESSGKDVEEVEMKLGYALSVIRLVRLECRFSWTRGSGNWLFHGLEVGWCRLRSRPEGRKSGYWVRRQGETNELVDDCIEESRWTQVIYWNK